MNKSLRVVYTEADQAAGAVRAANARNWFDAAYKDDADLAGCLVAFDVSQLAHRICLEMRNRFGLYLLSRKIVFSVFVPG